MGKGHSGRTVECAAAALEAVGDVILLHHLEVALVVVHVHEHRLKVHRTYSDALAAADAGGVLDMSVLFFGEEQHACGALDGGGFKARCADTHHRAAENDLARGLDEAAALLGEVLKRSADAGESVYGSLEGAARDGDDTLDNGLALIAGLIYRVRGTGADNVAADAGGDPAGLDLAAVTALTCIFSPPWGYLTSSGTISIP